MSSPMFRAALVVLGIGLIAGIDFVTGLEIRTFPLYYVPISLAAWQFGRTGAVAASGVSALGWLLANYAAGSQSSHPSILVVNMVVQAASFALVGLLVAGLRRALLRERALGRTDPLCLLLNNRAFYEEGHRLVELCRRGQRPITVAYCDIDNFKTVNDALGHQAGDDLIRAVAQVLQSSIRSSDIAARLGGDEFAILMPELGPGEARGMLERLGLALGRLNTPTSRAVTVSIGAATFVTVPDDLQAAIQKADSVMYAAKKAGKNRVQVEVVGAVPAKAPA